MWQDGNLLQIQKLLYKLCGVLSWSIRCSSLNTERRLWWYILNVYYNVLAIPTCTTFFLRHRSLYGFTIAREEYTIKLMVLLATTGLLLSLVSHNSQVRKKWTHVSIAVTIFANCFWLNLGIIFKNWLAVWTLTFFFLLILCGIYLSDIFRSQYASKWNAISHIGYQQSFFIISPTFETFALPVTVIGRQILLHLWRKFPFHVRTVS